MSTTQKIHKISLVVDAQTRQLRSVSNEFKALEREIARVTGKVDVMGTHFKANEAKMQKAMRTTSNASTQAHTSMGNDIVRHIRRVESLVVALYAVKKAYDVTLGRGHEFNKLIEQETTGLKLLIAQNLSHKDSLGNILTPLQKFTIAQTEATKAIRIAREVNLQTPHSFSETMQIYKLLTPQVLKYGGTLEETGKITKNVSIIASAMGVEFQQLLKTVDSAMSGEAKESGLLRALSQFGITNEAIKSTLDSGGSVVDLFITKLENADVAGIELATNWQGVTSKFLNVWDEMFAKVQKPIFDGMKRDIAGVASYIKDNSASIVSNLQTLGTVALEVGKAFLAWKIGGALIGKIKAIQFGMARMAVMAKQTNGALSTMDLRLMKLETSFRRVGLAMKSMFVANAPLIAMMVVYEAWNFLTGQIADKEEKLAGILRLKAVEVSKLTKMQQQDTLNKLQSALHDHRQITGELRTQLTIAGHKYAKDSEEYVAIRAKFDTHVASGKELKEQIATVSSIVDGTYKAGEAVYAVADGAGKTAEELQKASKEAYNLANALGSAEVAYRTQLIRSQELAGSISKSSALKQTAGLNLDQISEQETELNKLYAVQGANITDLNAKALNLATKRLSIENGLVEDLKSLEDKKQRGINKTNRASLTSLRLLEGSAKGELNALKEKQKQLLLIGKIESGVNGLSKIEEQKLRVKFLKEEIKLQDKVTAKAGKNTLNNPKSAKLKAQYEKEVTKQLDLQLKLMKAQETTMDKIFGNLKDSISDFSSAFAEGGEAGLGESIRGFLDDGINAMKESGDIFMMAIGYGIDLIRGLFNNEVSQAEIDASKGRVEFDDNSLKNLGSIFETAQYPMLEVTNKMHRHIRNMDANFFSVARALNAQASSGGVDLTGVNFVDTMESGFLGFSSKSVSLIGSGLKFELQELGEMMNSASLDVKGYTTSLVKKSSFFGLKKSSKIKETYKNLPPEVLDDMANTFADGFETILTAGTTLGMDKLNLENMLLNSDIDLGKIDFTGLSPSEVSDRLSQVFSTAFSGVIDGLDTFDGLIERYAKGSEYGLETLTRIATEFDQASHSFDLIGKAFTDSFMDVTRTWTEETIVQKDGAFGGIFGGFFGRMTDRLTTEFSDSSKRVWGGAFSWMSRFRGTTETITETFTETTQQLYTAQMQILDIVASTGGMTQFQDAMGAYMSGFYTETEQLGFITKSMEKSFATLGLEMPKTNAEFRSLLENMNTGTEEGSYLYGQVLLLADGFNQMTDASDSLLASSTSMADAIQGIADAWLGNLSYLTIAQKAEFASGYFDIARQSDGELNTVESARAMAETALKATATKEEYMPIFDKYIKALEDEAPTATTDDVVAELRALRAEVQVLEETTRRLA